MSWSLIRFGLPLFVSFAVIHLCLPYIIKFSAKSGWGVDIADERKIHQQPTPRVGGIGVFISFFLSSLVFYVLERDQILDGYLFYFVGLLLGSTSIFGLGLADDLIGLTVKRKLSVQIFIALMVTSFGMSIKHIHLPILGQVILPSYCAILLSVFWIVGITNTLNLIDGMDGLSSGITTIAAGALSVISFVTDQMWLAAILFLLCISSVTFLRYNWPPAKAFVGDSGAYLYGFVLATLSILVCYNSNKLSLVYAPAIILGLPIVDTTYAIGRRLAGRYPVFSADRKHIHHQLMDIGFSTVQTVLTLYIFCLIFAGLGICLAFVESGMASVISFCTIIGVIIALYLLNQLTRLKNANLAQEDLRKQDTELTD